MSDRHSQKQVFITIDDFKLLSPTHSPNFFLNFSNKADDFDRDGSESALQKRPKSTPWTSRPQPLQKDLRNWWWWDFGIDLAMILLSMPFFVLAATVIGFNGNEVSENDLGNLDTAIRGVCPVSPIYAFD